MINLYTYEIIFQYRRCVTYQILPWFLHVCIICYIHHWFYHIFYHGSILWFMATMGFVNRKFMPPSHARSGLKSSTCTGPLGNKIGPFYWNIMGESWDNGSPTSVIFFLVAVCYGIGGPFSLIYLLQLLVYLEFMSHFEPLWHCGGLQFELPRVKNVMLGQCEERDM